MRWIRVWVKTRPPSLSRTSSMFTRAESTRWRGFHWAFPMASASAS
jgi:hypothetical protein